MISAVQEHAFKRVQLHRTLICVLIIWLLCENVIIKKNKIWITNIACLHVCFPAAPKFAHTSSTEGITLLYLSGAGKGSLESPSGLWEGSVGHLRNEFQAKIGGEVQQYIYSW